MVAEEEVNGAENRVSVQLPSLAAGTRGYEQMRRLWSQAPAHPEWSERALCARGVEGLAGALFCIVLLLSHSAAGDAPPGRYSIAGGIVTDTATVLEWQQTHAASTMTWSDAVTYCQNLNLGGTGWRLPTMKELQTIVDETRYSPAIDATAFPGTPSSDFWSSSRNAYAMAFAWVVNFNYGDTATNAIHNNSHVRCVR